MMQVRRERILLLALLLAVVGVWWWALASGPRDLVITVLDVGQGDSILIQSPGGENLLIDGGGETGQNTSGYEVGREVVLPALLARRVRKVDVLVVTHPHDDHVGGLSAVVQQVPVGMVLDPMLEGGDESYEKLRGVLAEKKIAVRRATEGQVLNLGGGVRLEVLNPPEPRLSGVDSGPNDNSVVLSLTYGEFSALLAGDVAEEGATRLAQRGPALHSTVLKVPHHGSASAARTRLFEAVHPELAIISVGANNQFGHPTKETLEALARVGAKVMRTEGEGAITVRVRPPRWWAEGYVGGRQVRSQK